VADTGYHSRDGLKGPRRRALEDPHRRTETRQWLFAVAWRRRGARKRSRLRSGVDKQAMRKRGEMSAIDGETAMLVIIIIAPETP